MSQKNSLMHAGRLKQPYRLRNSFLIVCLFLLVLLSAIVGLGFGSAGLGFDELFGGLLQRVGYEQETTIIYAVRLPRVLAGLIAGVGLSVSGILLQTVTNNALASPNIIGVNAGAGFAVILFLFFFPMSYTMLPFAAFFGAFLTTLLILAVSHRMNSSKTTVILAGIAFTAILNAGISFISLLDPDVFTSYRYFSVGGFSGVGLTETGVPAVMILVCLILSMLISRRVNLLCLGDSMAASLGVRVNRLRIFCLILASASAAAVVSIAGLLGFVGLIVPHIARRLVGSDVRWLLPVSALTGAALVVLSDMLGRVLFAPTELPVGIILSLLGAPFFFFLLMKRKTDV